MQFTAKNNSSDEEIWNLILQNLPAEFASKVSPATSSFIKTSDGLECYVREANGDLVASCYSESDRMGHRRWTIDIGGAEFKI
tara:strand:+ start:253 stop:501 length:249 start_codon:yes stop_codon:yes gene_type:complete